MRRSSALVAAAICAAAVGGAGYYFKGRKPSTAEQQIADPGKNADHDIELDAESQKKVGLSVDRAITRPLVKLIRAPGMASFDERSVTRLKARTQGRITKLLVQPGDQVSAGQLLAKLDANSVLESRRMLETARASFNDAQAAQKLAQTALDRANYLVTYRATTPADVEKRQADLAKAIANVQSAQAQLDASNAQYEQLAPITGEAAASGIVSPIKGIVTSANVTLGEVIDTNQDAFTVADPAVMLVQANLYSSDIGLVKAGDAVSVQAPGKTMSGRVRSVNVALDPATNTAAARIELANPGVLLRANMFVPVLIEADLGRRALTIPASAVQITEQGPVAFVQTASTKFERRDLQLGLEQQQWVEVKSGINEGEAVATNGSFNLKAILLRNLLGSTN